MNYIEPIKNQLDKKMHNLCLIFMTIGTPRENPRWMNYADFNRDTKVLTIESTQTSNIFIEVETDFDFVECDKFWKQFKEYRTAFLANNYPKINPYDMTTKTYYEQIIIDSIDLRDYDLEILGNNESTLYTYIQNVYLIFKKEYVHKNNSDIPELILFKEWLQGLPSVLTVPFMNYTILDYAKKGNALTLLSVVNKRREEQEDEFLDKYWIRLSHAFFTLKENL